MWSLVLLLGFFPAIALVGWLMGVVRRKIDKRRIFNLRCGHGFFTNHDPSVQCPECRKEMDELIARNEARAAAQAAEREAMSIARRELAIEEAATRRLEDEMCRQEHEEQMRLARRIEHLRQMDPYEFELFVVEIFRLHGWEGHATPRSNDLGVDARMRKGETTALIQCKRYGDGSPVGRPAVQALCGQVGKEKASVGYVVTTSHFSEQAIRWAHGQKIQLIDHRKLIAMVKEVIKDDTHLSSIPAAHAARETPPLFAPANSGPETAPRSPTETSSTTLSAAATPARSPLFKAVLEPAAGLRTPAASNENAAAALGPYRVDAPTIVARLAAHPRRAANLDGDRAAKASEYIAQFDPAHGPVRQHPSDYLPAVQAGGGVAGAPAAPKNVPAPQPVVQMCPPGVAGPRKSAPPTPASIDPRVGGPPQNLVRQTPAATSVPWLNHAAMIASQRPDATGREPDRDAARTNDNVHRGISPSTPQTIMPGGATGKPTAEGSIGLSRYFGVDMLEKASQACAAKRIRVIKFDPTFAVIIGIFRTDGDSGLNVKVRVKAADTASNDLPKMLAYCGCGTPVPCYHIAALLVEIGGMNTVLAFLKDVAEQGAFCNRNPKRHHALSAYQFYRYSQNRAADGTVLHGATPPTS